MGSIPPIYVKSIIIESHIQSVGGEVDVPNYDVTINMIIKDMAKKSSSLVGNFINDIPVRIEDDYGRASKKNT